MRILIVGGVAAGASAATKARRVNEDAEIILFERSEYVSFANCGLPYHIGNVITDRDELLLVTPELFRARFNIDVRINHEVVDIDAAKKTIQVKTPEGVVTEPYDKLILATGGTPFRPDIPGVNLEGVHTLFTVPDTDGIIAALARGKKTAVVIGGGFIGLEAAENLAERGIKTIMAVRRRVLGIMDEEFAIGIAAHLEEMGVELRIGASPKEIRGNGQVESVLMDDGTEIPCDLVLLAMGARPNTELARRAGLEIGASGGVTVDATMRTSDPDIYAAGDMVESLHLVTGKKVLIPLAGSANKQGRVAGACAAGGRLLFKGVLGTAIIKIGHITVARTGLTEGEAAAAGLSYETVYVPGFSNATYYPGAEAMIIKLTLETPTGRLLGAQIIGRRGVDKRADVLATAIYSGLTVFDLENLDLAYAPPYSSAKDPVILCGMIASNILRGEIEGITPREVRKALEDPDTVILDVRTRSEFNRGAIPGAILIPVDELRQRYEELDRSKNYIVYCGVGYRAYVACLFLNSRGYKTRNLSGGYTAYTMDI